MGRCLEIGKTKEGLKVSEYFVVNEGVGQAALIEKKERLLDLFARKFGPFQERLEADQAAPLVQKTFAYYFRQLCEGTTGKIPEGEIVPVKELPDAAMFSEALVERGRQELPKAILIKLNGGLGTSMGLQKAKSLLEVKDGQSFLRIIAQQAQQMEIPLLFMNSFSTQADSLEVLRHFPGLSRRFPWDFLQHRVPKVLQGSLEPALDPNVPERGWCPPGHGDVYTALVTSGMLTQLLEGGIEYAFLSNADNLGACMDLRILGYFASHQLPFLMEVADRTEADKKGGHLARRASDGQLLLRESAQCLAEDKSSFQDVKRHTYFNTNNIWIHLPSLQAQLDASDGVLGLPLIRNAKTLDPRDPTSPRVFQLETAMGSAISVFPGSRAIRVPRSRFAPVKTTDDLVVVRSDAFVLDETSQIVLRPERNGVAPLVSLDPAHYRVIDQLATYFPHGVPSLLECERLEVRGKVYFGQGVVCRGRVLIEQRGAEALRIPDGTVLEGL